MTHVPLSIVFLVFTVACTALIIMRYQIPLPDWYAKKRAVFGPDDDGGYFFAMYPSHQEAASMRGKHRFSEIKGVHLKGSHVVDMTEAVKLLRYIDAAGADYKLDGANGPLDPRDFTGEGSERVFKHPLSEKYSNIFGGEYPYRKAALHTLPLGAVSEEDVKEALRSLELSENDILEAMLATRFIRNPSLKPTQDLKVQVTKLPESPTHPAQKTKPMVVEALQEPHVREKPIAVTQSLRSWAPFPKALLQNKALADIDPFDPSLTKEQKAAIIKECKTNMAYFLRITYISPNDRTELAKRIKDHIGSVKDRRDQHMAKSNGESKPSA